jgi:two-component system NarL family sensor kinase
LLGASRVRRELVAFVGVGLLVLIIISIRAVLIIKQVAERHALRADEQLAKHLAEFVVAPALDAVLNGNAAQRGELDRMLDSRMRDGSITEMNVWTAESRVVYSDNPAVIGRLYEPPAEVVAAVLLGETHSTLEWTPGAGATRSGCV